MPKLSEYLGDVPESEYTLGNSEKLPSLKDLLNDPLADLRRPYLTFENVPDSKYDYGILPGMDVENIYGHRQTGWGKWGNGLVKFAGKTATAFAGGMATIPIGLGSVIASGSLKGFWDNDFYHMLDRWNEGMDKALPNYYTEEEREYNLGRSLFTANFWANDLLGAISFTTGAVLTELSYSALTAATLGAFAPAQAVATAGLVARGTKYLKGLLKIGRVIEKADDVNAALQLVKGAGMRNKVLQLGRVGRQVTTGAGYEAGVETRDFQKRAMDQMTNRWLEDHPGETDVPIEVYKEFQDAINISSNGVFAGNLALVGSSNMVALPRIFGPGIYSKRAVAAITRQLGKDMAEPFKAAYRIAGKGEATLSNIYTAVKNPFVEGIWEEGGQFVTQETALDYVNQKYSPEGMSNTADVMEALGEGLEKTFTSKQGWKEMGIGMMIGSIGMPNINAYEKQRDKEGKSRLVRRKDEPIWTGGIPGAFTDRKLARRAADDIADIMNKQDVLASTKSLFKAATRQYELAKKKDAAIERGDFYEAKNLESDEFINFVQSRVDGGHFWTIEEELADGVSKMESQEFAQAFGYDNNMTDKELSARKSEVVAKAVQNANEIRKSITLVDNVYKGRDENTRDALIYTTATAKNVERRINDITGEIAGIAPSIDTRKPIEIIRELYRLKASKAWLNTYERSYNAHKGYVTRLENEQAKLDAIPLLSETEESKKDALRERIAKAKAKVAEARDKVTEQTAKLKDHESNADIDQEDAERLIEYKRDYDAYVDDLNTHIVQNPENGPRIIELMNDMQDLEKRRLDLIKLYNLILTRGKEWVADIVAANVERTPKTEKEKAKDKTEVEEFATRIQKGEKIEAPEDMQFYEDNKKEIEKELAARKKKEEQERVARGESIHGYKPGDKIVYNNKEYEFLRDHETNKERIWVKLPDSDTELSITIDSLKPPTVIKKKQGTYVSQKTKEKAKQDDALDKAEIAFDLVYYPQIFGASVDSGELTKKEQAINSRIEKDRENGIIREYWEYFEDKTDEYGINPQKIVRELSDPKNFQNKVFELFVYTPKVGKDGKFEKGKLPIAMRIKGTDTILGYLPVLRENNLDEQKNGQFFSEVRATMEAEFNKKKENYQVLGETTVENFYYYPNNRLVETKEGWTNDFRSLSTIEEGGRPVRLVIFSNEEPVTSTGAKYPINKGHGNEDGILFALKKAPDNTDKLVQLRTKYIAEDDIALVYDMLVNPDIDIFDKKYRIAIENILGKGVEIKTDHLKVGSAIFFIRKYDKGKAGKHYGDVMIMSDFDKKTMRKVPRDEFIKALAYSNPRNSNGKLKNDGILRHAHVDIYDFRTKGTYQRPVRLDGTDIITQEYKSYYDYIVSNDIIETDLVPGDPQMSYKMPIIKIDAISGPGIAEITEVKPVEKTEVEQEDEGLAPWEEQVPVRKGGMPSHKAPPTIEQQAKAMEELMAAGFNPAAQQLPTSEEPPPFLMGKYNLTQEMLDVINATKVDEDLVESLIAREKAKKPRLTYYTPTYKIGNYEEAKKWFSERFPDIPIEQFNGLLKIGDQVAHGYFENAMVRLSNIAEEGSIYHEAFHVSFDLYTTVKEKKALYKEAREKYGDLDTRALEEKMAEDFRVFVMKNGSTEVSGKIGNFFQRLWEYIKSMLGLINSREFYNMIETGAITRRWGARKMSIKNKKALGQTRKYRIPGLNDTAKEDVISTVAYDVFAIWNNLNNKYKIALKEGDTERQNIIRENQYLDFYFDYTKASLQKSLENAKIVGTEEYNTLAAKLENVLEYFDSNPHGKSIKELVNDYLSDKLFIQRYDLIEEKEENPEDSISQTWGQSDYEVNPAEKISFKLKQWLAFLPKTENGYLGRPRFNDYVKMHNFLMRNLYGMEKEYVEKRLQELSVQFPGYVMIYKKYKNESDEFKSLFYSHFAGKQKLGFWTVVFGNVWEKGGKKREVKIIDSSRQSLSKQIVNDFVSNYSSMNIKSKREWSEKILGDLASLSVKITGDMTKDKGKYTQALSELVLALKKLGVSYYDTAGKDIIASAIHHELVSNPEYATVRQGFQDMIRRAKILANSVMANDHPFENETTTATFFARIIENYHTEGFTENFYTVDRKRIYSYTTRNYISDFFNDLKGRGMTEEERKNKIITTLAKYLNNPMYQDSVWLNSMVNIYDNGEIEVNDTNLALFDFSYFNGAREDFGDSARYKKLSPTDFEAVKLNMYINQNAEKFNYYVGMNPAEKPNLPVYKVPRITERTRPDAIRSIIEQDIARINTISKNTSVKDLNIKENIRFMSFPVLNNLGLIKNGIVKTPTTAQWKKIDKAVNEFIKERAEAKYRQLKAMDLIRAGRIVDIDHKSDILSRYKATPKENRAVTMEFLKEYMTDYRINYFESQSIFSGDSRFYTKIADEKVNVAENVSKRTGHQASGEYADNSQMDHTPIKDKILNSGHFNLVIGEDPALNKVKGGDAVYQQLLPVFTKKYGKEKAEEYLEPYKNTETADAQGYATLERYGDLMRRIGRTDEKFWNAYNRAVQGKPLLEEELEMFQILKGVFFDIVSIDGMVGPIYVKYSLAPLIPNIVKGTQLEDVSKWMKSNQVHEFVYESGIKTLKRNPVRIFDENNNFVDESVSNDNRMTLNTSKWRLQMETAHDPRGENVSWPTQARRVMMDNINDKNEYGDLTGRQIKDKLNGLHEEQVKKAWDNLSDDIGIKEVDGKYKITDKALLSEALKEDALFMKLPSNIMDAIQVDEKGFMMPFSLPQLKRFEPIIVGIFRNRLIRQRINGVQAIQFSSQFYRPQVKKKGLTEKESAIRDNLNYVFNEDGSLKYVEIALSNWIAEKYGIKEGDPIPEELRHGIGIRIPTSGKSMTIPVYVKTVLSRESGNVVIVPHAIITQMGTDFDIDKLFLLLPSYYRDKDGNLNKIEYYGEDADRTSLYVRYIYSQIEDKKLLLPMAEDEEHQELVDNLNDAFEKTTEEVEKVWQESDIMGIIQTREKKVSQLNQLFKIGKQLFNRLPDSLQDELRGIPMHGMRGTEKMMVYHARINDMLERDFTKENIEGLADIWKSNPETVKKTMKTLSKLYTEQLALIGIRRELTNEIANKLREGYVQEEQSEIWQEFREWKADQLADEFGLPRREEFLALPVNQINSKAAIDNEIIDTYRAILSSEHSTLEMMRPNTTKNIKKIAEKIYTEEDLDPYDDIDVAKLTNRAKESSVSIGVFANLRRFIGMFQESKAYVNPENAVVIGDKIYDRLDRIYNDAGEMVSFEIGSLVSMSVDDQTDPLAHKINSNTFTANTIGYLTYLMDLDYALSFINQPIIKELTREVFKGRRLDRFKIKGVKKNIDAIRSKYITLADKAWDKKYINKGVELSAEELKERMIEEGQTPEWYAEQVMVLNQFEKYSAGASELAMLMIGTKADAPKGMLKSTLSQTEEATNSIESYLNNPNKIIQGVDSVFADESTYPLVKSYYDAIIKTMDAVSDVYPFNNAAFRKLKESISVKIGRALTSEEIDAINADAVIFSIYKITDGDVHNFDRNIAMGVLTGANSVKARLSYMKRQYPDHPLLRNLQESDFKSDERSPVSAVNFNNVIDRSAWNKDSITYDFEDVLYGSETEEMADFYDDLVTYSLWTTGFENGYTSFSEYIPLRWLAHRGFRDALIEMEKESHDEGFLDEFEDIFFKNSYRNDSVVPYISKKHMKQKQGKGLVTSFAVDKMAPFFFDNEYGTGWPPFLTRDFYNKKTERSETLLYEMVDSNLKRGIASYTLTDKYGWPGKLKELTGQESIIKENYVNPEDFADYEEVEDDIYTPESDIGDAQATISDEVEESATEEESVSTTPIYENLGNKTQSTNVAIKPWSELKDATKATTSEGIVSTRIKNSDKHFGNPFSHDPEGKSYGLIKTETVKEAVQKYIDWILGKDYSIESDFKNPITKKNVLTLQDITPDRVKWIREQLQSGELKSKPILYYKELGEPSHATALDYLINNWENIKNQSQQDVSTTPIQFKESESSGYRARTMENASADATIALAVDFNSAGEKLTKSSVLSQGKIYVSVPINMPSGKTYKDIDQSTINDLAEHILSRIEHTGTRSINIAGNGIYTLKGTYTQDQLDNLVYEIFKKVTESYPIESIVTGGQTGVDEAGAKAGMRLGIPTTVNAPKGWTFRNKEGIDISNEQQFKERFGVQPTTPAKETPGDLPAGITGDILNALMSHSKVQRLPSDAKALWSKHGETINKNLKKANYRAITEEEFMGYSDERRKKAIECYG